MTYQIIYDNLFYRENETGLTESGQEMTSKRLLILGDTGDFNKEVELCRSASPAGTRETISLLIEERIPFSKEEERIPILQRRRYHRATHMNVIMINRNRYDQARELLGQLSPRAQKTLILS